MTNEIPNPKGIEPLGFWHWGFFSHSSSEFGNSLRLRVQKFQSRIAGQVLRAVATIFKKAHRLVPLDTQLGHSPTIAFEKEVPDAPLSQQPFGAVENPAIGAFSINLQHIDCFVR